MKTSEKIKALRIAKGISQEALGEMVGVKKAAINKYEKGRVVNIKRSTLQRLAIALNVKPADLLDDEEFSLVQYGPMSPKAQRLLDIYNGMNSIGQDKLLGYAQDLASSGNYTQYDLTQDPST